MNFSENLKNAKNFAIETALAAKDKATQLAAIAKANIAIYAEELSTQIRVINAVFVCGSFA